MKKSLLLAALILPLGLPAGAADAPAGPPEVKAVVESTVNGIIDVLKDKKNDREARRKRVFAIMDGVADFGLMGKLTLGAEHWPKFDEAQRKEFTDSFSRAVRDSCFEKVEIYTDETVEFGAPGAAGKGKVRMPITILSRGQRYKVVFKLWKPKAAWKIYDLEVEGMSFIKTYAAQYDQVLRKGTPQDLLGKLKAKSLGTPDDVKSMGKGEVKGKGKD